MCRLPAAVFTIFLLHGVLVQCWLFEDQTCLSDDELPVDNSRGWLVQTPENQSNITIGSESMPLGIAYYNWDSAFFVGDVYRILASEVLGLKAVQSAVAGNTMLGLYTLAGCSYPERFDSGAEAAGCGSEVFTSHVIFEAWGGGNLVSTERMSRELEFSPENLGDIGYRATESMYVLQAASHAGMATRGLALEFYRSYNRSWHAARDFFPQLTDFNTTDLKSCDEPELRINSDAVMSDYFKVTGDEQGIIRNNGRVRGRCVMDSWWPSPACRDELSACIPLITQGDGWGVEMFIQQVAAYRMPIAVATAASGDLFASLARNVGALVSWWTPDTTFVDLEPMEIILPPRDASAWKVGDRRTRAAEIELSKWGHARLGTFAPEARHLARRMSFGVQGITVALLHNKDTGETWPETACWWLRNSYAVWNKWIPDAGDCLVGKGMVDANGIFLQNRSSGDANGCDFCPPGRFSEHNWRDRIHICVLCSAGKASNVVGATGCFDCMIAGGRVMFAAGEGNAECSFCPDGASCAADQDGLFTTYIAKAGYFLMQTPEHERDPGFPSGRPYSCFHGEDGSACLGANTCYNDPKTGMPAMGGVMCGRCLQGYSREKENDLCIECPDFAVSFFYCCVNLSMTFIVASLMSVLTLAGDINRPKQVGNVILKQVITYVQTMVVVWQVAPVSLGSIDCVPFFKAISILTGSESVGFGHGAARCLLMSVMPGVPLHVAWQIVALLWLPLWLACCSGMFGLVVLAHRLRRVDPPESWRAVTTTIVHLFMLHPRVTRLILQQWHCFEAGSNRLVSDPDVQCNFGLSAKLGLLGISLYSLGIPLASFLLLWYHHRRRLLFKQNVKEMLGFLYLGFDPGCYYFESVFMIRKVIFEFVYYCPVLLSGSPEDHKGVTSTTLMLVAIVFFCIHVQFQPFDDRSHGMLDAVEYRSLVAITGTLTFTSWMWVMERSTAFHEEVEGAGFSLFDATATLGTISVIFLHLRFMVLVAVELAKPLKRRWFPSSALKGVLSIGRDGLYVKGMDVAHRQFLANTIREVAEAHLQIDDCFRYETFVTSLRSICSHAARQTGLDVDSEESTTADMTDVANLVGDAVCSSAQKGIEVIGNAGLMGFKSRRDQAISRNRVSICSQGNRVGGFGYYLRSCGTMLRVDDIYCALLMLRPRLAADSHKQCKDDAQCIWCRSRPAERDFSFCSLACQAASQKAAELEVPEGNWTYLLGHVENKFTINAHGQNLAFHEAGREALLVRGPALWETSGGGSNWYVGAHRDSTGSSLGVVCVGGFRSSTGKAVLQLVFLPNDETEWVTTQATRSPLEVRTQDAGDPCIHHPHVPLSPHFGADASRL